MSQLIFNRSKSQIVLTSNGLSPASGPFTAFNNVDSTSRGSWPAGQYDYVGHILHSDISDPEQAYGLYGILVFNVPGRSGMGVHSGRRDIPDGLGRKGPAHATMGCIRTTDEAMAAFLTAAVSDALTTIAVVDVEDARLQAVLGLRAAQSRKLLPAITKTRGKPRGR